MPENLPPYSVTEDRKRVDCLRCDRMIVANDTPLSDEEISEAVRWHMDDCGVG